MDRDREPVNESRRTAETYERHADAYREKYRAGSVAARHDDDRFLPYYTGEECAAMLDAAGFAGEVAAARWVSTLAIPE